MFDRGERIVEVMQKAPPFLILRRAAEAEGVIFQSLPPHQQQILIGILDATMELMCDIARAGCDDGRSLRKGAWNDL